MYLEVGSHLCRMNLPERNLTVNCHLWNLTLQCQQTDSLRRYCFMHNKQRYGQLRFLAPPKRKNTLDYHKPQYLQKSSHRCNMPVQILYTIFYTIYHHNHHILRYVCSCRHKIVLQILYVLHANVMVSSPNFLCPCYSMQHKCTIKNESFIATQYVFINISKFIIQCYFHTVLTYFR